MIAEKKGQGGDNVETDSVIFPPYATVLEPWKLWDVAFQILM